jgi:hypothetical protein
MRYFWSALPVDLLRKAQIGRDFRRWLSIDAETETLAKLRNSIPSGSQMNI